MFKNRSYEKELMDDLDLHSDALRQNLKELKIVNKFLGGYDVTLRALNTLRKKGKIKDDIRLADIGSGGGDMLREMALWFRKKQIKANLFGMDANQFMVDFGKNECKNFEEIQFFKKNIFDLTPQEAQYDIITLNLFCHHFTEKELSEIFKKLKNCCNYLIINDLERNPIAYYSIKFLTILFNGSYLVKNDAPLSVLRAFNRNELLTLLKNSGYKNVTIRWQWAFRWQVIAHM